MALINPLLGSNLVTGPPPFDSTLIGNSVWLDGSADLFTKSSFAGHASKKVISVWVQRTGFSAFGLIRGTNSTSDRVGFGDNVLNNQVYVVVNGKNLYSNQGFRDIGWYHYLVSFDLTQSTASNKVKVYINSVDIDNAGGWQVDERSTMSSSFGSFNSASVAQQIGRDGASDMYLNAYLAQYCELDGQSIQSGDVATTDFYDTFTFGTNGSQIIPKADADIAALATTAGSNSFCLDFSNSSDLGNDISSNNHDFTATSISSANQSVNTPSKVYPIVNALTKVGSAASTLEEGNTKATVNDNGGIVINPTLPFSGLWYFEINVTTNNAWFPGIGQQSALGYNSTAAWNDTTAETHVWLSDLSSGFNNNGSLTSYPIANPLTGRFAVAWDGDNRALYFGQISGSTITWTNSGDPTSGSSKTGAAPGNWPTTGTDPLYFIVLAGGGGAVMEFDFDEDDWTGVTNRPAAAKVLNSANLTAPDYQGIDYFNAVKYTGNGTAIGSGGKAVTGTGFKPDLAWIKNRDATDSHAFYDVVRGTTKQIESDTTAAESTESEGLTTFGSDGFTVGNLAQVNTSTEDYVAWQWLASNSTSTNTNGSLNTTVTVASANHFSIVGWTMSDPAGAKTLGHGLSAAPELIIVKNRTDAGTNWPIYAEVIGNTKYMYLSTTAAAATFNMWQDTSPTSTVFSVSSNNEASGSANDEMIAYCFRSVPGVCKVGSYEGNSIDDGPYISLGFKPRWWLVKETTVSDASHDWFVADSARYTFNGTTTAGGSNGGTLEANDTTAEEAHSTNFTDNPAFDFLSDGIKIRTNSGTLNGTGRTYVYMAMADIGGNGTLPPIYGR